MQRAWLAVGLVVLALAAAGCGKDGDDGKTASATTPAASTEPAPETTLAASTEAAPSTSAPADTTAPDPTTEASEPASSGDAELPGLYEVDGRKVHMDCRGTGSPVVILDAGLGVLAATTWAGVHDALAEQTTVCSYDRAGMGLSEPGPKPRTAGAMADELHALLQAAEVEPPYILVGASFGAFVDELYAFRHPDDVAGLVLVDGLHPDLDAKIEPILGKEGTEARKKALAQNAEGVTFKDLLASDEQVRKARPLPPVPLVALQHGISFDEGGEPLPALEELWGRLQQENAELSPEGQRVIARNSHHRIAEDEPDIVVDAVRQMLDAHGG
jgi:hypothetical protein